MSAETGKFEYTGYGCPSTEMWSLRYFFEKANPHLDLEMRKDAPHYDSAKTRIAYSMWENYCE